MIVHEISAIIAVSLQRLIVSRIVQPIQLGYCFDSDTDALPALRTDACTAENLAALHEYDRILDNPIKADE